MNQNKKLLCWIIGIFGSATLLCAVVIANDLGFVDHLFDFHLDVGAIKEQVERENRDRQEKESKQREWVADLRDWGTCESNERGTIGPPDRDN